MPFESDTSDGTVLASSGTIPGLPVHAVRQRAPRTRARPCFCMQHTPLESLRTSESMASRR